MTPATHAVLGLPMLMLALLLSLAAVHVEGDVSSNSSSEASGSLRGSKQDAKMVLPTSMSAEEASVSETAHGNLSVAAPSSLPRPATGYTALHSILAQAKLLETVQVTGTANLTDSCLSTILSTNPLSLLRRLVISNPSAQESMVVVPLTARSVLLLHQKCPNLQCLGDLRHWAVSPAQRGSLARQVACSGSSSGTQQASALQQATALQARALPEASSGCSGLESVSSSSSSSSSVVQQAVWTKVTIPSSGEGGSHRPRSWSVLVQSGGAAT